MPVSNTAIRSSGAAETPIRLRPHTIAYNVIEAVIALTEGTRAQAVLRFGPDSLIEVSSAAVVAWQFSTSDPEARERNRASLLFHSFALAAYVCLDASLTPLLGSEAPALPRRSVLTSAAASLLISADARSRGAPALNSILFCGCRFRNRRAVVQLPVAVRCSSACCRTKSRRLVGRPLAALFVAALAAYEGAGLAG